MQNYRTSRPKHILVSTDVDACTENIKKMLVMSMDDYLHGMADPLESLSEALGCPVESVSPMTYREVCARIVTRYPDPTQPSPELDRAVWALAVPYLLAHAIAIGNKVYSTGASAHCPAGYTFGTFVRAVSALCRDEIETIDSLFGCLFDTGCGSDISLGELMCILATKLWLPTTQIAYDLLVRPYVG